MKHPTKAERRRIGRYIRRTRKHAAFHMNFDGIVFPLNFEPFAEAMRNMSAAIEKANKSFIEFMRTRSANV